MKKLILILTMFLLVSSAFAMDNSTKQNENLSTKELITLILLESDQAKLPSPANKFAPFNIKLNILDKNESLIVAIDKEGNLNILDSGKSHILVELNFEELISSGLTEKPNPELLLEKVTIIPTSFKGALVLNAAEKIMKRQLVNQRSFGYKAIGILAAPISLFIK